MTADLQKTANALVWCSIGALLSLLGFTLPGYVLILIGALLGYRACRAGGFAVCSLCIIALLLIQTVTQVYRSFYPMLSGNALTNAPYIALTFCLAGAVWFLMSACASALRGAGCGQSTGDCRITQALAIVYLALNAIVYVLLGPALPFALLKLSLWAEPLMWLAMLISLLLARSKLTKRPKSAPKTVEEMRNRLQ